MKIFFGSLTLIVTLTIGISAFASNKTPATLKKLNCSGSGVVTNIEVIQEFGSGELAVVKWSISGKKLNENFMGYLFTDGAAEENQNGLQVFGSSDAGSDLTVNGLSAEVIIDNGTFSANYKLTCK